MTSSSGIEKLKNKPKSALNPTQKTFNRLKKTIENLQKKEKQQIQELDQCLKFYHFKIHNEEQQLSNELIERVKIVYKFLKTENWFSKSEKKIVNQIILNDIETIFRLTDWQKTPAEIHQIFKELSGKDYQDIVSEDFRAIKTEMEETFKNHGIDINLSDIKATDREAEMLEKLFQSFFKTVDEKEADYLKEQKTNKQIEKELVQQTIEEVQKKSINSIYKQLAKVFHPDLEQDIAKKSNKEKIMKQLTIAYENKDLYTLLSLEIVWINSKNDITKIQSQEQLKIYNKILKEQIKDLHQKIDTLFLNPNYSSIQRFFNYQFTGIRTLHTFYQTIANDRIQLQRIIKGLCTSKAKEIIQNAIREFNPFDDIISI